MSEDLDPANVRSIALILIGRLGDYLVTTPFLRAMRERFPKAHIALLTSTKAKEPALLNKNLSKTYIFHNWLDLAADIKMIGFFTKKYDVAIDLNPAYSRTSLGIIAALKSPEKITFKKKAFSKVCSRLIDNGSDAEHFSGKYERLAALFGAACQRQMEMDIPFGALKKADELLAGILAEDGRVNIAIHPGNFKKTGHRWPEEKFVEFTKKLLSDPRLNVFYLIGPGEEKISDANILRFLPAVKRIQPRPLAEVAAILKKIDIFVCNNTGTLHLCAAVGTPTFSFNTQYSLQHWKPKGEKHFHIAGTWGSCQMIPVESAISEFYKSLSALSLLKD
ncbi:MAG: hypothetical protein NTX59_12965 [Elusimicrobia bacterium]|nr:hypothetical protein [Elusimicrobiota bacterium]